MPIVDFAQDPTAAYGTGNFRDDKGRVMYLHDPETAQAFAKTMPGSKLASQVADESSAIASRQMGDPGATLGSQVALESDAIARGRFGGQAPSAGRDLIARLDQVHQAPGEAPNESSVASDVAPPTPGMPPAAPVAPAAAPAPGAPPAGAPPAPAPPGAAPAPAAPAPATPAPANPAQLVQNVTEVQNSLKARSAPTEVELPKPNSSAGLPLYSVHSGDQVSIEEGRPVANALEQLGEEAPLVRQQIDTLRGAGAAKDKAAEAAYREGERGKEYEYTQAFHEGTRAIEARKEAEREQARVSEEIKRIDTSLDPDRVVKNMSTGKRIGMIILAALNGAFGALIGQKGNGVIDALNSEIERDIERQKLEVANRKTSLNNDYKKYLDMGMDAKQAEALARGKLEASIAGYRELETKRVAATGENARAAELLVQPLLQAWVQRKGDVMKETEAKVKRAREEGVTHQLPPVVPGMTPQGQLAELGVKKERIEQDNAKQVGDVLGHPVSPEEAARIKQDAQEYALKGATNQTTRGTIAAAANEVGLVKTKNGWVIGPNGLDPGVRPLGTSAFSPKARAVDMRFSALKEAKIMGAAREPANTLQREFGDAIERPFNDSDLPRYFNQLEQLVERADANLRKGYGEAATFYDRTPESGGRAQPEAPEKPAAPGKPARTPAQKAAAEKERQKTERMFDLREE